VAAEALWKFGHGNDRTKAEEVLAQRVDLSVNDAFVTLAALSAIDAIGVANLPEIVESLSAYSWTPEAPHDRYREYVPQLARSLNPAARD
jgi:hypothetical protein